MVISIVMFQLDLKTDPDTGLPVRRTIKFGTNCDLSDEKKWKHQIQVALKKSWQCKYIQYTIYKYEDYLHPFINSFIRDVYCIV